MICYIGGISGGFFLLIGITIVYCFITVKREKNRKKINDENVASTPTTFRGAELPAMRFNSRAHFGIARATIKSLTPWFLLTEQKHSSDEYVLHDPSKSVLNEHTYENCC